MKEVVQRRGWCVCRGRGREVNMERKCRLQKSTDEPSVICRTLEASVQQKMVEVGSQQSSISITLHLFFFHNHFNHVEQNEKCTMQFSCRVAKVMLQLRIYDQNQAKSVSLRSDKCVDIMSFFILSIFFLSSIFTMTVHFTAIVGSLPPTVRQQKL